MHTACVYFCCDCWRVCQSVQCPQKNNHDAVHNALILRPVLGANDARLTTHETCSLPSSIKDSWLEWDGARWARAPAISCTALPHTPERLPASTAPCPSEFAAAQNDAVGGRASTETPLGLEHMSIAASDEAIFVVIRVTLRSVALWRQKDACR